MKSSRRGGSSARRRPRLSGRALSRRRRRGASSSARWTRVSWLLLEVRAGAIRHARAWLTRVVRGHMRRLTWLWRRRLALLVKVRRRWTRTTRCTRWRHGHELRLPRGRRAVHILRRAVLVHRGRERHLAHELLRHRAVRQRRTLHARRRHLHGRHHAGLSTLRHALRLRLAAGVLVRRTAVVLVDHAEGLLRARSRRSRTTRAWCGHGPALRCRDGHLARVERLRHGLRCLSTGMHTWLHHSGHKQASAVVHGTARRRNDKVLTVRLTAEGPHGTYRLGIGHFGHLEGIEILADV